MANIIYILTNEAMPGLVKIGFTQNLEQRMRELSSPSGVPLPFECHYAAELTSDVNAEWLLHQAFSDYRINPKREFFRMAPEKAIYALRLTPHRDVTPGENITEDEVEKAAVEKVRERRERIRLAAIGIHPGAVLTFSRDPNRTCEVLSNNKVRMEGEELTLSRAAIKALQALGYQTSHASGSQYWLFGEETLDERRIRLEAEQFDGAETGDSRATP